MMKIPVLLSNRSIVIVNLLIFLLFTLIEKIVPHTEDKQFMFQNPTNHSAMLSLELAYKTKRNNIPS